MVSGPHVVLVDDHPLTAQGLRSVLECEGLEVAGVVTAVEQVAALLRRKAGPVVVVCDLHLAGRSGSEAVEMLCGLGLAVLAISGVATADGMLDVVAAGARGFVPKTAPPGSFLLAVRSIAAGSWHLSPELAHHLLVDVRRRPLETGELGAAALALLHDVERGDRVEESLVRRRLDAASAEHLLAAIWEAAARRRLRYRPTPRETEILRLVCQGLSHRALSEKLHVSVHTVPGLLEAIKVKYLATHPDVDRNATPLATARRWALELGLA